MKRAGKTGGSQAKITGFLKVGTEPTSQTSLSSKVSKCEKSKPLIISPSPTFEHECIEKTPDLKPKKKFLLKSKRPVKSPAVSLNQHETNSQGENSGTKRKFLEYSDENRISSPVFKKSRSRAVIPPASGIAALTEVTNKNKEGDEDTVLHPSKLVTPTKKTESVEVTEEDLFACLDDSPFKTVGPSSPVACEDVDPAEVTLATGLGRHRVLEVVGEAAGLRARLQQEGGVGQQRSLLLANSWAATPLVKGDILHLDCQWDAAGYGVLDDTAGLLTLNPDTLLSGTSVVSALFCTRKAVLAERFKGVEGGNRVMLVGTVVHELLQEVLRQGKRSRHEILRLLDIILVTPRMMSDLCMLGLTEQDMRREVEPFVGHIQYFVRKFILGETLAKPEVEDSDKAGRKKVEREQWRGRLVEIRDIEENFWSPRLGIKGKIDLTVETEDERGRRTVRPLELKTGKPSYSTSHMGQASLNETACTLHCTV